MSKRVFASDIKRILNKEKIVTVSGFRSHFPQLSNLQIHQVCQMAIRAYNGEVYKRKVNGKWFYYLKGEM